MDETTQAAETIGAALQGLEHVMREHKKVMRGAGSDTEALIKKMPDVRSIKPPYESAIRRLSQVIESKTGIKVSNQLTSKLTRIFSTISPDVVNAWAEDLICRQDTHPEWPAFVEMLTIHETYFFRDWTQLEFLRDEVLPVLIEDAARGNKRLKIWSAACSSGEEAYSLAMIVAKLMVDMGHATWKIVEGLVLNEGWQISFLGTDISRPVIIQAEQARYSSKGLSSFRSMQPEYEFFFEGMGGDGKSHKGKGTFRVHKSLRDLTVFKQFNLLDPKAPEGDFDVVVCRNVFIYMQDKVRIPIQSLLASALRPNGYLMQGTTDRMEIQEQFKTIWSGDSVIYRKKA